MTNVEPHLAPNSSTTRRRLAAPRGKRFVKIIAVVLVALAVLLSFAPALIGIGPVRRYLLTLVNDRIPGTVSLDDLGIGWFSAASIQGLVLVAPDGSEVILNMSWA